MKRGLSKNNLKTGTGIEAKRFLSAKLADSKIKTKTDRSRTLEGKKGSAVVISTTKSDKFDRYLVDVWVDELYLNQVLVEKGYASRWA